MGKRGRHLMVSALAATVADGEMNAVGDIVKFCMDRRILFHISEMTLCIVNRKKDYEMMKLLIDNHCYYRVRIKKPTIDDEEEEPRNMRETSLRVSAFLENLLFNVPQEDRKFSNKVLRDNCFNILQSLQHYVNYEETIDQLRNSNMTELVYLLIDTPDFSEENRIKWLLETFKYALKNEQMDVAVNLWETYKGLFDRESPELVNALLECFE